MAKLTIKDLTATIEVLRAENDTLRDMLKLETQQRIAMGKELDDTSVHFEQMARQRGYVLASTKSVSSMHARTVQRPAYQPEPWQVERAQKMAAAKAMAMSGRTTVKVQA